MAAVPPEAGGNLSSETMPRRSSAEQKAPQLHFASKFCSFDFRSSSQFQTGFSDKLHELNGKPAIHHQKTPTRDTLAVDEHVDQIVHVTVQHDDRTTP